MIKVEEKNGRVSLAITDGVRGDRGQLSYRSIDMSIAESRDVVIALGNLSVCDCGGEDFHHTNECYLGQEIVV